MLEEISEIYNMLNRLTLSEENRVNVLKCEARGVTRPPTNEQVPARTMKTDNFLDEVKQKDIGTVMRTAISQDNSPPVLLIANKLT